MAAAHSINFFSTQAGIGGGGSTDQLSLMLAESGNASNVRAARRSSKFAFLVTTGDDKIPRMSCRPQFSLKTLLLLPVAVAIFFAGMATQRYLLGRQYQQMWDLTAAAQKLQLEVIDERAELVREQKASARSDGIYESLSRSKLLSNRAAAHEKRSLRNEEKRR